MDIRFKSIEDSDLELIMAWRNNPEVYQWTYLQKEPLRWEDHRAFWSNLAMRSKCSIIEFEGRRVGYIGYKLKEENTIELFIFIGEPYLWGHSIGTECINKLCEYLRVEYSKVRVSINDDNLGSQRAFIKCGFELQGPGRPGEVIYGKWL